MTGLQENTEPVLAIHEKALATRTGLVLANDTTYPEWEAIGELLDKIEGSVHWWIGDWLNFGEQRYGEMYSQPLDETKYEYKTLRNDKYVADKVELSRRRDNLSYSHHCEVAPLEPKEQEYYLELAEPKNGTEKPNISVHSLRRLITQDKQAAAIANKMALLPEKQSDRYRLGVHDITTGLPDNLTPGSADVIITDPPYPEEYLYLYRALGEYARDALKPGGSLLAMCGQSYLPKILNMLSENLSYQWIVAYLTPGGQAPQIWQRKVNAFWKPVIWFVKGEYSGSWIGDVTKSEVNDNDKRFHHWGQSESGMADLVERFSMPGDLVADPFCGAGTTGVVALDLDRRFAGYDIDEMAMMATKARLLEASDNDR